MISQRSHKQVHRLRRIRDGDERAFLFCEGARLVEELLKTDLSGVNLFTTPAHEGLARRLAANRAPVVSVTLLSDGVMAFCSDVKAPPGLVAIARRPGAPSWPLRSAEGTPLFLVIHRLQLPQNVGAVIRTAEGAGVSAVSLADTAADPFSPKALRASAGSAFRLPIFPAAPLTTVVEMFRRDGVTVLGAASTGRLAYDDADWSRPIALVIGSEGAGFTPAEETLFDQTVRIPMGGRVASLNVGVAAAVCLFEARRQRTPRDHRKAEEA